MVAQNSINIKRDDHTRVNVINVIVPFKELIGN